MKKKGKSVSRTSTIEKDKQSNLLSLDDGNALLNNGKKTCSITTSKTEKKICTKSPTIEDQTLRLRRISVLARALTDYS